MKNVIWKQDRLEQCKNDKNNFFFFFFEIMIKTMLN